MRPAGRNGALPSVRYAIAADCMERGSADAVGVAQRGEAATNGRSTTRGHRRWNSNLQRSQSREAGSHIGCHSYSEAAQSNFRRGS